MGKATITFTDTESGTISVRTQFSPDISFKDNVATPAQRMALEALNACMKWLTPVQEDSRADDEAPEEQGE